MPGRCTLASLKEFSGHFRVRVSTPLSNVQYMFLMAAEDYHANWRGARRLQFDEEQREKAAAADGFVGPWNAAPVGNVLRFRRLRHSDPVPFKVLIEDLPSCKPRAAHRGAFIVTMAAAGTAAFMLGFFVL